MKSCFGESVCKGHPDKLADAVVDAILDTFLAENPHVRCALEALVNHKVVVISGEVEGLSVDESMIQEVVRATLFGAGYKEPTYGGFSSEKCNVEVYIKPPSSQIPHTLKNVPDQALLSTDQGILIGFASDEFRTYIPMAASLAHILCKRMDLVREQGEIPYLLQDGKSLVITDESGTGPVVKTIVIAIQHKKEVDVAVVRKDIREKVVEKVLSEESISSKPEIIINGYGPFNFGGPDIDTGVTGRKIVSDSYGSNIPVGGGAISGKDPGKTDRIGVYAARHIAKNIVCAGLARRVLVGLTYAFGKSVPLKVQINTFGTGRIPDEDISRIVESHYQISLESIMNHMQLRRPIYSPTSIYGHFGRDELNLPWERTEYKDIFGK